MKTFLGIPVVESFGGYRARLFNWLSYIIMGGIPFIISILVLTNGVFQPVGGITSSQFFVSLIIGLVFQHIFRYLANKFILFFSYYKYDWVYLFVISFIVFLITTETWGF